MAHPFGGNLYLGCPTLVDGWPIATNIYYTPAGAIASYVNGAGITVSDTYNNRLQPWVLKATNAGGTDIFKLTYDFSSGHGDNGNVSGITNNLASGRSQTFRYDSLNRLNTAGTVSTTCAYCWGNSYSIDAWGNLLLKTVTAGSAETWSQPATGKNQISAWGYDLAGNQNSVSGHVYNLYNAENQWTSQSTYHVNYVYDGDGKKVKDWGGASGQRIYVQDPAGHAIMEVDQNGTTLNEYLYFGDSRIARVSTEGGPVYYYYGDHLGTARVITDGVGNKCYDADYFPWGLEQHVYTNSCPQNYKFTGKERDPDTGSDYFGARWYRYDMSRFFSPDWAVKPVAVPYADFGNPQSLNLYSYVLNNPLGKSDPDGHDVLDQRALMNAMQSLARNQYVQGGTQVVVGVGLVATAAAGDVPGGVVGALLITNAAIGGTATAVNGTTQIIGAATHTDTSKARETISATSTLPGLATAAAGGNLKAAATVSTITNAATLAAAPKEAVKNAATAADAAQTVKETTGLVQNVISTVKNWFSTPPSPPAPKPPPPPTGKKESCPQCV